VNVRVVASLELLMLLLLNRLRTLGFDMPVVLAELSWCLLLGVELTLLLMLLLLLMVMEWVMFRRCVVSLIRALCIAWMLEMATRYVLTLRVSMVLISWRWHGRRLSDWRHRCLRIRICPPRRGLRGVVVQ